MCVCHTSGQNCLVGGGWEIKMGIIAEPACPDRDTGWALGLNKVMLTIVYKVSAPTLYIPSYAGTILLVCLLDRTTNCFLCEAGSNSQLLSSWSCTTHHWWWRPCRWSIVSTFLVYVIYMSMGPHCVTHPGKSSSSLLFYQEFYFSRFLLNWRWGCWRSE